MWKNLCRFTSSDLFSNVVISLLISKMITAKILTSDYLTNILYVTVFIIAMFIESDVTMFIELNVDLEISTLVKVTSCDFDYSISFFFWLKENNFWLNWVKTEEDHFSIWVKVKLFCFMINLLFISKVINFKVKLKFENWRKSIHISMTRLILFIHVFSRIIWCWFNWIINIKAVSII